MIRFLLIIVFAWVSHVKSSAQPVLGFEEYMALVRDHHPLAMRVTLQPRMANANSMMARGGFDPKFAMDYVSKQYADKSYYNLFTAGIKIPTWYGIELKSFYDQNSGDFINESDILPANGLWTAGISFPLARGIVLDDRRAELQKAKIFERNTQEMQRAMLNDLYFDAAMTYLEWQQAYLLRQIAIDGLVLASTRFDITASSVVNGDKPGIDTTEIQGVILLRNQELLDAEQVLDNARMSLNNYLWIDGSTPMEVDTATQPEPMDSRWLQVPFDSLRIVDQNWINTHPDIRMSMFKLEQLEVDNKLFKEDLKPDIRLEYNPLIRANNSYLPTGFNGNDYKWGARVYYPLLLRKERGKVAITNLKIQDAQLELNQKRQSLNVKVNNYYGLVDAFTAQLRLIEQYTQNTQRMLEAENIKFNLGESSVFLVNSREVKFLEARIKEIETKYKLSKNKLTTLYLSGTIGSNF